MATKIQIKEKYILIGLLVALLVLIWGLTTWISACHYIPNPPKAAPKNKFTSLKPGLTYPLNKYQSLLTGKLFFGTASTTMKAAFRSRLVLWGLAHRSEAIVGTDPLSNQITWMVKVGDTVEGEKIVAIGNDYIVVRNQTGEGRVTFDQ